MAASRTACIKLACISQEYREVSAGDRSFETDKQEHRQCLVRATFVMHLCSLCICIDTLWMLNRDDFDDDRSLQVLPFLY